MKLPDYYRNTKNRTENWKSRENARDALENSLRALPELSGKWIDIGCQSGGLLNKLGTNFEEAVGVDIGNYSDYWKESPNVNFVIHDLDEGPICFPDSYFDLVTCFMVIEHVFDVFGALNEIARLTKTSGSVVVEIPNAGYFKHILSLIRGIVPRTGAQDYPFNETQGWDGQHLHYFTLSEFVAASHRYDLQLISHNTRGRFPALRRIAPSLLYSSLILTFRKQ